MTREFRYLLRLTGLSAVGAEASEPAADIDWERVCVLAKEQTVQHLVAYALKKAPQLSCPMEIRQRLYKEMRVAATVNSVRVHGMLQILDEMRKNEFRPVLLKGWSLAPYYAAKECRISTDTDIWIERKDEIRAFEFLRSKGFSVEERAEKGHHSVCYHPDLGLLELHTLFYDEIVEEVWFGKRDGTEFIKEDFVLINTADGTYEVLGDTDYLIFLALHLIKHFIISGISIRMLLDVALFYAKNKEGINLERFWETINRLKYTTLMNCILRIAIEYCGFSPEDFPGIGNATPAQIEAVLDDLEQGGWLGEKEKEQRNDGKREYNKYQLMKGKTELESRLYMLRWEYGNFRLLFPSKTSMIERYPYLKSNPFLLPIAWMHRLFVRGTRAIKNGALVPKWSGSSRKISPEGQKRIELFRQLDLMK